jgi:hypothetical protein
MIRVTELAKVLEKYQDKELILHFSEKSIKVVPPFDVLLEEVETVMKKVGETTMHIIGEDTNWMVFNWKHGTVIVDCDSLIAIEVSE